MKEQTTLIKLIDLLNRFYQGDKLSTSEIETLYDVSKRTSQRYIEYLKKAGLDIKKENKKYFLDIKVDDEILKELAKNLGISSSFFLKKIKENIFYSKLDIEKIDVNQFEIIEQAIKEKKELKVKYKLKDKTINIYIKPLKITNFDGYWYLNALNNENKYKTYHIKTFEKIELTDKTFYIKNDILKNLDKAINIWFDPLKEPFLVELLASEDVIKYFQRVPLSKTQTIIKNQDNTYTIQLSITHSKEIIRKLLMWIPEIVVLSPKWLKDEMDEYIKKYMSKFLK